MLERALNPHPGLETPKGVPLVRHPVIRVRDHRSTDGDDHVAVEEPLEIRIAGTSLAVTMRTPGSDAELIAGLLFSEGVISGADNLDVIAPYGGSDEDRQRGNVVNVLLRGDVRAARERLRRLFVASSSCGLCGKLTIDSLCSNSPPITSDLTVPMDLFQRIERA
ncbi:MAG TPA: formate dehydrogenase accessory sulfurtransferase FdhD, partial [Candidatus Methylomirabilis sp.]|nr:formate dehydrogenase accessory sulfurtransferase FdhD [Candidatus Methylomirabilis sp.]